MHEVLQYLKDNQGERLDADIAEATGMSLEKVRRAVSELSATGKVMRCRLTRFENGKSIEGWLCRISGYIPPAAPGRKPKGATPVKS